MIISDVAEPTQHSTEFSLKECASNNALLPKKSIYVASYKRPLDLLKNGAIYYYMGLVQMFISLSPCFSNLSILLVLHDHQQFIIYW